MKHKPPWTLPNLLAANRNAVTVYAALCWLAKGRRQISVMRKGIAEVCNLYKDTIGKSVKVLDESGWLRLRYGRYGGKSWYRITLLVKDFPLCPQKPASLL